MIQGNLTQEQAFEVDNILRSKLKSSPLPADAKTDILCAELPSGVNIVRCDSLANEEDTNTLVCNYYQAGPGTIRDQAVMEAIVLLMEEPVFDTLRTQEQLGYQVSMTFRNTFGVFGLSVTVNTQANKFTADHVDQRVEIFFKTFVSESINKENVSQAIQSLLKLKVCEHQDIRQLFAFIQLTFYISSSRQMSPCKKK